MIDDIPLEDAVIDGDVSEEDEVANAAFESSFDGTDADEMPASTSASDTDKGKPEDGDGSDVSKDDDAGNAALESDAENNDQPAESDDDSPEPGMFDEDGQNKKAESKADDDKDKTGTDDGAGTAADDANTDKDPDVKALAETVRKLEGSIGGLKGFVTKAISDAQNTTTTQGKDSPTQKQISEALEDDAKYQKLKKDFPEFADALGNSLSQFETRMEERLANVGPSESLDLNTVREYVRLDNKHPEWEDTIKSKEFKSFAIDGGPSEEERDEFLRLEISDPDKAIELENEFIRKYPEWWASKGALMSSDRAIDAIKLLDKYVTSKKESDPGNKGDENKQDKDDKTTTTTTSKNKNQDRLKSAVQPNTSSGKRQQQRPKTENEIFEAEFNK